MRETKWTPGPWTTRGTAKGDIYIEQAPAGAVVAKTFGSPGYEERANSHLLAAAPELYEALYQTQQILRNTPYHAADIIDYRIKQNEVALAKARGESQ